MKPVQQTIFGMPSGNCFAACVASLLELPLDGVPNFCGGSNEDWYSDFTEWLRPRGCYPLMFDCYTAPGLAISSGKSPRGNFLHAVITEHGVMVHDPHPSGDGIVGDFSDTIVLVPMDPASVGGHHNCVDING